MGWETRGNNQYYYRKRRQNGRVLSDYVGAGPLVELLATFDEHERQEREAAHRRRQRTREADLMLDKELLQIGRLVRDLQAAALLANGCYTHRRQWRRSHEPA